MPWTGLGGVCDALAGCALAEACVALVRPGGGWLVAAAGVIGTGLVVGAVGRRAVAVLLCIGRGGVELMLAGGVVLTVCGKDGVAGVIVASGWFGAAGPVVSDVCGNVAGAGLAGGMALFPV